MELHVAIPDSYRDIFLDVWQNMFVSYQEQIIKELNRFRQKNVWLAKADNAPTFFPKDTHNPPKIIPFKLLSN